MTRDHFFHAPITARLVRALDPALENDEGYVLLSLRKEPDGGFVLEDVHTAWRAKDEEAVGLAVVIEALGVARERLAGGEVEMRSSAEMAAS